MSDQLNSIIQECLFKANELQHEFITADLLCWILLQDDEVREILTLLDVDLVTLQKDLLAYLESGEGIARLSKKEMELLGKNQFTSKEEHRIASSAGVFFQPEFTDSFQLILEKTALHLQSAGEAEWAAIHLLIYMFDIEELFSVYLLSQFGIEKFDLMDSFFNPPVKY